MSSFAKTRAMDEFEYPSSDGKPMAETEVHRINMSDLIDTLQEFYRDSVDVYVGGNMLMYYVPGDKRKHVSPDVFVVHKVCKQLRDNYLVWQEGKAPDLVIELTSRSTRAEDEGKKFNIYQDILKVREYFLFDPKAEYLRPALKGYRLSKGHYLEIRPIKGRLPSQVLGLHLERRGAFLRLIDPASGKLLLTSKEARQAAEAARQEAEAARQEAEAARQEAEAARLKAEQDAEVLREELKLLRKEKEQAD